MEPETPCNFDAIAPGSQDKNPCSPQVDDDFRGLRINAPREVFFGPGTEDPFRGGFTKIIVAGYCELPYPALGLRGVWNRFVLLVAVDSRNRQVFAGTMLPFGSPARPMDPLERGKAKPEDFANAIIGKWFNPNIARDLHLPEREAEYDVYATLGPYKSNVVHIKVSRQK